MLIDTHIHLDAEAYRSDWAAVLERALDVGVAAVIAPSTGEESARTLRDMARQDARILPAVGIHPHDAGSYAGSSLSWLRDLAPAAVAIGEIGLDYHYDFAPRDTQLECLRAQLRLAAELGLPVILHCREAEECLHRELTALDLPAGGVVHCFTGGWEWAPRFLDLGFHLGVTGMVTFPRLREVHEVAARAPLDRLLLETDGPYLAPIPYRGRRNEPGYIPLIARRVADLRGEAPEAVGRCTTENARRLFGCRVPVA
ncbi:MAG: TatD family hydrolase [Candidatus Eremiobacterota bacterium]